MLTLSTYGENSAFDVWCSPGFNPSLVAMDGRYSMMDPMVDMMMKAVIAGDMTL